MATTARMSMGVSSASTRNTPSASRTLLSSSSSQQPQMSLPHTSDNVFRHHDLLMGNEIRETPLLDYADLSDRIEMFKNLFTAHLDHMMGEMEKGEQMHGQSVADESKAVEMFKERIERQKEEQKALYNSVSAERQAESSAQSQLALLQASRTSLGQRISEAETERERLFATLDRRKREYDQRKSRLAVQVKRNKPELVRFNQKLGCRVSAGQDNGGKDRSIIKFTFSLVDPNDWGREAHFIIDASRTQYQVLQAKPMLPTDKVQALVDDLNKSRALFTFIKRMRAAFKEEIEQEKRHGLTGR